MTNMKYSIVQGVDCPSNECLGPLRYDYADSEGSSGGQWNSTWDFGNLPPRADLFIETTSVNDVLELEGYPITYDRDYSLKVAFSAVDWPSSLIDGFLGSIGFSNYFYEYNLSPAPSYILRAGEEKARFVAEKTMRKVRKKMGLVDTI